MTELGTIAIYDESGANVFNVALMNVNFPDGWAWDVLQRVITPVTGMGVDGTRMRLIRNDFPRFRMVTYSDYTDFGAAVNNSNSVMLYKGYRATLLYICNGVTYNPTDFVYIWDVRAMPMPCELASTVGNNANKGLMRVEWELQFTKAT